MLFTALSRTTLKIEDRVPVSIEIRVCVCVLLFTKVANVEAAMVAYRTLNPSLLNTAMTDQF
jgi:hypothetical protein